MKNVMVLVLALSLLSGCAWVKQAVSDYKTGKEAPVEEGEKSPAEQAGEISNIVSNLPFVGPYAPMLSTALIGFFTWRRGKRIRSGMPVNTKPATGFLGNKVGAELLVQTLSDVFKGFFEIGKDNSPLKRGWKVFLSSALGIGTLAVSVPSVADVVVAHPEIAAGIAGISGLFAGLEKALSAIQPVGNSTASKPTII